jgi:sensor domain DACNV-containing protein
MVKAMPGPSYPAARVVAPKIEAHFSRHAAGAESRGLRVEPEVPDANTIERLIDTAFWASLRREENYVPRISLALVSPKATSHPLLFETALPLDPGALVRVAPAVERAGIHLGVWRHRGNLSVWGTTRAIPPFSVVVEVAAPGLLVVKHHRGGEGGKFVNVAVLEGDQIKLVDENASSLPECPPLLASLLGFGSRWSWTDSVNVLVQLAVSMRVHGRGGSLLVVPDGKSDEWRESIVRPIPYTVVPSFAELAELHREIPDETRRRLWQDALQRAVEAVAGLTAVDGATIITNDYELLAFGAKIMRRRGSPSVEQVMVTEPIEGGLPLNQHPTQLGGTRHLSAAQFVHDQRNAVALVASQDGRFTVFAWSPCEDVVHAHRVETLLM